MGKLARFFLQNKQPENDQVRIGGADAHHITRVLRLKPGDLIECVDQLEQTHLVEIRRVGETVLGQVKSTTRISRESPLSLTLFQALAKGAKMDWIVQKAAELGVSEFVPFSSGFTVVKLNPKQAQARRRRWERIALEAAKQSGRTRLPVISPVHGFDEVAEKVKERHLAKELILLAYEAERQRGLGEMGNRPRAVSVLIGPEGGFSEEEVQRLAEAGAKIFSLGPRILRTETAGLVALSLLGYKWGDLG